MIDVAIEHLAGQANEFLKRRFDLSEDIVVLSSLQEQDGSLAPHIFNKVTMFLVRIERDAKYLRSTPAPIADRKRHTVWRPPVCFNLFLMVAAHFSGPNYVEALKALSNVIQFFQARPVFDHQNSPGLHRDIKQLALDIENMSLSDQALVWGALSGRYLPSVLYKVRMVAIDGAAVRGEIPALESIATDVVS